MGQYHYTVNLDKKQFIHPHKLGDGLKLLEQCGWSPGGTNDALHMLLAVSSGRGGGDFQSDSDLIGSWGGDRIAIIGDYAEDSDLPSEFHASEIYSKCSGGDDEKPEYEDITDTLIPVMEREYEVVYVGDRWRNRFDLSDLIAGFSGSHGSGDRSAVINGAEYSMKALIAAVKDFFKGKSPYEYGRNKQIDVTELGIKPIKSRG